MQSGIMVVHEWWGLNDYAKSRAEMLAELRGVASFHGSLPPATAEQAAKVKSRILVAHGDSDGFVPAETVTKFKKALSDAGVERKWNFN